MSRLVGPGTTKGRTSRDASSSLAQVQPVQNVEVHRLFLLFAVFFVFRRRTGCFFLLHFAHFLWHLHVI